MSIKKNTTKIISMIKLSSEVFRMFVMTINNKNEKMTETRALVWLLLSTALRSWESVSLWWVLRLETYRRVAILEVKGQNTYGERWWGMWWFSILSGVGCYFLLLSSSDTLEVRRCGGLVVVRSSPNWAGGVRAFALRSVVGHNTVLSRCLSPCKCTNAGG